jgi:hypothetical protein
MSSVRGGRVGVGVRVGEAVAVGLAVAVGVRVGVEVIAGVPVGVEVEVFTGNPGARPSAGRNTSGGPGGSAATGRPLSAAVTRFASPTSRIRRTGSPFRYTNRREGECIASSPRVSSRGQSRQREGGQDLETREAPSSALGASPVPSDLDRRDLVGAAGGTCEPPVVRGAGRAGAAARDADKIVTTPASLQGVVDVPFAALGRQLGPDRHWCGVHPRSIRLG